MEQCTEIIIDLDVEFEEGVRTYRAEVEKETGEILSMFNVFYQRYTADIVEGEYVWEKLTNGIKEFLRYAS